MTTPSGDEILHAAMAVSPSDVSAVSSWLINQQPPPLRGRLVASVRETIRRDYLSGGPTGKCRSPQLFDYDQAVRIWNDLQSAVSPSEDSGPFLKDAADYFRPNESAFTPIAYPGTWPPAEWNYPLSPGEVRRRLKIRPEDVEKIRRIVLSCAEADQKTTAGGSRKVLGISAVGLRPFAPTGTVRVGVLPYTDTLALPALLFAVSDLVPCLDFGPASFYRTSIRDEKAPYILDGSYAIGYSTAHELSSPSIPLGVLRKKQVFDTPFERSILLRAWGELNPRDVPRYVSMSFVGHFAANRRCKFDRSDRGFPVEVSLDEPHPFDLTRVLDPIADWEPELVMAFLSNVAVDAGNSRRLDGRAIFLSTDAHLWCNYSGLFSCADTRIDVSESDAMRGVRNSSLNVRVGRASWQPSIEKNASGDVVSDEDMKSNLCWFMRRGNSQANDHEILNTLVSDYIISPASRILNSSEASVADQRERAAEIARCLLAPLLKCHPWYRGPMMSAPPEQWLVKLFGPSAYLDHVPSWRKCLADVLTRRTQDVPGDVSSLVQKLSRAA